MSSATPFPSDSQEPIPDVSTLKRPLEATDTGGEMEIMGGATGPKKAKRVITSSDDDLSADVTVDMTVHEQTDGAQEKALIKKDEARVAVDEFQFERVVLCIQNVRDVGKTLQPGYQITTKICKQKIPRFTERILTLLSVSERDAQGRYNVVAEEDKSADYHFDIKHPPLNKPVVPKVSRETFEAQMGEKLHKVQALARGIISTEHITIRLVNDSGENIHLLVNFAQSSKSSSSSNAQPPVKEKPSKK